LILILELGYNLGVYSLSCYYMDVFWTCIMAKDSHTLSNETVLGRDVAGVNTVFLDKIGLPEYTHIMTPLLTDLIKVTMRKCHK
jgi:hypothetical protein